MKVRQRYYSRKDISTILNISKTRGLQIMHMFEQRGKLFRNGRTLRIKVEDFDEWLSENTTTVEGWRENA